MALRVFNTSTGKIMTLKVTGDWWIQFFWDVCVIGKVVLDISKDCIAFKMSETTHQRALSHLSNTTVRT
jgi:hypothetical protein